MMELFEVRNTPGFKSWGALMHERPYLIVYDTQKKEYTASTKVKGTTIYILDYGQGVQTIEEAKEAVLKYHKKVLS